MYQPYPSSGKPVEPEQPPAPPTVLNAVKLMYVGAAITTVYTIVSLVSIGDIKSELHRVDHKLTTTQLNADAKLFVTSTIIYGVVTLGLWLLMAWANKAPRSWARIVATVLFALNTFFMLGIVIQARSIILILPVLEWLAGAGVVYLLWRRESSAFYNQRGFA
jgi:hypothetical protein